MKPLAHETYGSSQHFWYEADLMTNHDYGKIFNHSLDTVDLLASQIKKDKTENPGSEDYYWYFGQTLETMLVMIRLKKGQADVQINLKDFDFALHVDAINTWKAALLQELIK